MSIYVYTSIALNYFSKARVLSTTLKKFHPNWKFCMLVAEDVDDATRRRMLSYDDIDEVIEMSLFKMTLSLRQIYYNIKFPKNTV